MTLDAVLGFLENNSLWTYFFLFCGSYLETLIGFSFFLYGEVFFLAGGILSGMGILDVKIVLFVLFFGGLLGDFSSYLLGRIFGKSGLEKMGRLPFFKKHCTPQNYQKGALFFEKHGAKSMFLARFLGPVAWITPFLIGMYRIPYSKLFFYNLLGVILGIGQFVLAGFFFGMHYQFFLQLLSRWFFFVLSFLFLGGLLYFLYKKYFSQKKNNDS